jgi:hypothetical protein
LAAGLISAAFSTPFSPWAGLIIGPAVGVVVLVRQLRFVLTFSAIGLVVAGGLYVAVEQAKDHFVAGASWPAEFRTAGLLCSIGVLMLGADALAERMRTPRVPTKPSASPDR